MAVFFATCFVIDPEQVHASHAEAGSRNAFGVRMSRIRRVEHCAFGRSRREVEQESRRRVEPALHGDVNCGWQNPPYTLQEAGSPIMCVIDMAADLRLGNATVPAFRLRRNDNLALSIPWILGSDEDRQLRSIITGRKSVQGVHVVGRIVDCDLEVIKQISGEESDQKLTDIVSQQLGTDAALRFREIFLSEYDNHDRNWNASGFTLRLAIWTAIASKTASCVITCDLGTDPRHAVHLLTWGSDVVARQAAVVHLLYRPLEESLLQSTTDYQVLRTTTVGDALYQ